MPIIVHRPEKRERKNCSIGIDDFYAYIGGPVLGAEDFQNDIIDRLAEMTPKDRNLHIANPRWTDINAAGRLSMNSVRSWDRSHRRIAAHMGKRGVLLFYAAACSEDAPMPASSQRVFDRNNTYNFIALTDDAQRIDLGAPVILGIDKEHTMLGMQSLINHAVEHRVPIYDGVQEACAAAASLLFEQPAAAVH